MFNKFQTSRQLFRRCLQELRRFNISRSIHQATKYSQIKQTEKPKLILGIETSCDDTCAAVMDTNRNILSNVKSSQISDVIKCGGVMTVTSVRLHSTTIRNVILKSLKKAGVKSFEDLSAIAITVKPGQITSLDIGIAYAKRLALSYNLPLIPIHHMEAHALTAMICHKNLNFPFLALLISGGHSQIVLMKSLNLVYLLGDSLIGQSIDCGPGEVIDKIARNLKLKNLGPPYDQQSGGQSVEMLSKLVKNQTDKKFEFKILQHKKVTNCDFNYGGIRSYYKRQISNFRKENEQYPVHSIKPTGFRSVDIDAPLDETCFLCTDLQANLVNMFVGRLERAIRFVEMSNIMDDEVKNVEDIKLKAINYVNESPIELPLVVSGGVACNETIMNELEQKLKLVKCFYSETKFKFYLPRPFYLCTDNAVMIAWNGVLKYIDSMDPTTDSNYLLTDRKVIENLESESDARLGIRINQFIKKLSL